MINDRNLGLSHIFHIDLKIDSKIEDELDDVTKSHHVTIKTYTRSTHRITNWSVKTKKR